MLLIGFKGFLSKFSELNTYYVNYSCFGNKYLDRFTCFYSFTLLFFVPCFKTIRGIERSIEPERFILAL